MAHADFFVHSWDDHSARSGVFDLGLDVQYYTSDTNFDASGDKLPLTGPSKYSRMESDLTGVYGITPELSAFGRLTWGRAQVDNTILPGAAFGLLDQSIGLNYRVYDRKSDKAGHGNSVDLQLQVDLPAYSNTNSQANGTPYLGDGSADITFGGFLTLEVLRERVQHLKVVAGVGYTYRSSDFSASVPWSVSLQFNPPQDGVFASVSLLGMQSLKTDPRANQAIITSNLSPGSGGSFITDAINPSIMRVRGEIGYQFGAEIGAAAGVDQAIWGQAAPMGLNAFLGLNIQLGGSAQATASDKEPSRMTPIEYGHANQGFVNYSLEAHVLKANDQMGVVRIDKGQQDAVEEGQYFDLFTTKPDGTVDQAVARARVVSVHSTESALNVVEYFREIWIDPGFIAKRVVQ